MHSFRQPLTQNQVTRRQALRLATSTALGLSIPARSVTSAEATKFERHISSTTGRGFGKTKSVIMLWLLGGISQVESWDPKPKAPKEVRGEFGVIKSVVPGILLGELLPKTSRITDQLALLRAVVTNDNGHSSSGYHMLTGVPHSPTGQDNIEARFPNFAPSQAALVRAIKPDFNGLPSAIALPYHIRTDAGTPWPGQGGGDLGRKFDPWLVNCDPSLPDFRIAELNFSEGMSTSRLAQRKQLLSDLERGQGSHSKTTGDLLSSKSEQAFNLLKGNESRKPFMIDQEPVAVRDRYGRYRFGQSTLLARRLVEAGVSLVQVNWTRIDGYDAEGAWDTHGDHCKCAKSFLMPMFDQTFSALIEDLKQRGRLDETLVIALSEFGRTPRFNRKAGRDHWGSCFSVAMAGGGVRGGIVHGESDRIAASPLSGMVTPADLISTILHCLGIPSDTVIHDQLGRPMNASRGKVIFEVL